jgi:hypothetical protein
VREAGVGGGRLGVGRWGVGAEQTRLFCVVGLRVACARRILVIVAEELGRIVTVTGRCFGLVFGDGALVSGAGVRALGGVGLGCGLFFYPGLCQEEAILRQDDPRVGAVEVRKCDVLERALEKTDPDVEMEYVANQHRLHDDGDVASSEEVRV